MAFPYPSTLLRVATPAVRVATSTVRTVRTMHSEHVRIQNLELSVARLERSVASAHSNARWVTVWSLANTTMLLTATFRGT